jgi:hypothetical protein
MPIEPELPARDPNAAAPDPPQGGVDDRGE